MSNELRTGSPNIEYPATGISEEITLGDVNV